MILIKPDIEQISSRSSIRNYFPLSIPNDEKVVIDLANTTFISRSALQELIIIIEELRAKGVVVDLIINSDEINQMYNKVLTNSKTINKSAKLFLHKYNSDEDIYKYLETVK